MYFEPLLTGFPMEFVIGAWRQKLELWGYGHRKTFVDIFSRLDTIHERDRQTDRQMDGHRATAKTALTHSVAR